MRKLWYKANPSLLAKMKTDVEKEYPDLRVLEKDNTIFVVGTFPLVFEGLTVDRYEIELRLPPDFPDSIPVVRETGGKIPWKYDRHVNPDNGEACPIVPEEWLLSPDHDSLVNFLDCPLRNFFMGQSLVEQGDPWPFGGRSHGIDGLFEAYGELLGTTDRGATFRYLTCLSNNRIKGHWECPCGSKKKLRNCHLDDVCTLKTKVPSWVAKKAVERLLKTMSRGPIVNYFRQR